MKYINVADIVQDNGKTIRENNLARSHNIPIGTLVEVKYDTWEGDGACLKVHARLWVISHDRDCDGTPLYSLSNMPFDKIQTCVKDICVEVTGEPIPRLIAPRGEQRFWHIARTLGIMNKTGFPEHSLTPIEVTEEIKRGEGSLGWDEEELNEPLAETV